MVDFSGAIHEDTVISIDICTMVDDEGINAVVGSINGSCSFVSVQLFVGSGVQEVIGEHTFNVFFVLEDAGPKVFI